MNCARTSRTSGLLLLVLVFCRSGSAQETRILEGLPDRVHLQARYVIYLHGRIIEDQGPRPQHPTWGIYEYRRILEALASDGTIVIGERRPPMTDMDRFATHVVGQVRFLLGAGVRPEQIAVVGLSKGGGIAMRASALLQHTGINFVFLAACGDGDFRGSELKLWGRILSVYEASDEDGRSCASLFARSVVSGARSEVRINTGDEHGAFFRPREEWLGPVRAWIRGS